MKKKKSFIPFELLKLRFLRLYTLTINVLLFFLYGDFELSNQFGDLLNIFHLPVSLFKKSGAPPSSLSSIV